MAAAIVVIVAGALAVWGLRGGSASELANPQALYQFKTHDFHAVTFDPGAADTIFFGHHEGMKQSRDAGRAWKDTIVEGIDAMQIAIPASDPRYRYIAGHGMFVRSGDGGKTWEQPAPNLPDLDLHGFTAAPSDPLRLYTYTMGSQNLFTSADGGDNWEPRTMPPGERIGMLPMTVAPDSPLHLFASGGSLLAESLDGGQTWQSHPGPGGTLTALALAPGEPAVLYAGTDQGLWRRAADGAWQQLPLTPDGAIMSVAASPSQPGRIAVVDEHGYFYRSDDAGQTWVTPKQ